MLLLQILLHHMLLNIIFRPINYVKLVSLGLFMNLCLLVTLFVRDQISGTHQDRLLDTQKNAAKTGSDNIVENHSEH